MRRCRPRPVVTTRRTNVAWALKLPASVVASCSLTVPQTPAVSDRVENSFDGGAEGAGAGVLAGGGAAAGVGAGACVTAAAAFAVKVAVTVRSWSSVTVHE